MRSGGLTGFASLLDDTWVKQKWLGSWGSMDRAKQSEVGWVGSSQQWKGCGRRWWVAPGEGTVGVAWWCWRSGVVLSSAKCGGVQCEMR